MRIYNLFLAVLYLGMANTAIGAPNSQAWDKWSAHKESGRKRVDHGLWKAFLAEYLDTTAGDGIHRVRYGRVTKADREALDTYVAALQAEKVSALDRKEQKAYWINLYNAMTVAVVLRAYPVASIREIKYSANPLKAGPWDADLMQVEGAPLSLNDIEHRILRPLWKDNRIHFALNCASLGCPNLAPEPYTAANTETLLEKGTSAFVQSPLGSALSGDALVLSSIFDWYKEDFGGDEKSILAFLSRHAEAALRKKLPDFTGKIKYQYDWRLNDADPGR